MWHGDIKMISEWARLFLTLSVVVIPGTATERLIHGDKLRMALEEDIADPVLGTRRLQNIFDDANFAAQEINGTEMIGKLATQLEINFNQAFKAVEELHGTVRDNYQSWMRNGSISQCCAQDMSKLEYDYSFKNDINVDTACTRISKDALPNAGVPFESKLLTSFKKNRAHADLVKWQYIGTEKGILTQFPVQFDSKCGEYDNRFRPWYVEAATPEPKDIVLVIDKSSSMGFNGAMESAIQAAITLVSTLNPNDRVGVVPFSDDADFANLCRSPQLAFATSDVKKELIDFIKEIRARGTTEYLKAFTKAFDVLKNAPTVKGDLRERHLAIVFLTDGKPTDGDAALTYAPIYNLTSVRNEHFKNKVVILTYGFGDDIGENEVELLTNISAQHIYNHAFETPTRGKFTKVNNTEELRVQLGSYYTFFRSVRQLETPIITVPYFDYFGLGLVTSVCLPVITNSMILGVTCVDVRIADILGDTAFFEVGNYAYVFVIDGTGRVLIHPNLPNLYSINHSPSYLTIGDLEPENTMEDVIESMKSGQSGFKRIQKKFILTRGTTKREGVAREQRSAKLHWSPVAHTNLSVCLVYAESDRDLGVESTQYSEVYYHRLDLVNENQACNHNSRLGLIEASVVKFSGEAFVTPHRYFDEEETAGSAKNYEQYMEGGASNLFKPGVRDMVSLTGQIDSFWKERNQTFAISTYIATFNGIIRVYPGIVLDMMYDPKERSWFKRAIANKGHLTFAVPYIDAFGFGLITTLSQTVYLGRPSKTHSQDDLVTAVIGLDMRLEYIGYLLNMSFPACKDPINRCFLVDTSGYLIYSQDFENEVEISKLDHLHIMEQQPDIATELIKRNYLRSEKCTDFFNKQQYKTWRLDIPEGFIEHYDETPSFDLQTVQNSNVYVGIRKHQPNHAKSCTCPKRNTGIDFIPCRTDDGCECPCYLEAVFNMCDNTFSTESETSQYACKQERQLTYTSPVVNEIERAQGKPACFSYECAAAFTHGDCVSLEGCEWCVVSEDLISCAKPSQCTSDKTPTANPTEGPSGLDITVVASLAAVGSILLLFIIIVIVMFGKKCFRETQPTQTILIPDSQSHVQHPTQGQPRGENNYNDIDDIYLNAQGYDNEVAMKGMGKFP